MNAEQFYHICRSAAAIAGQTTLTVFGAAAVTPWISEANKDENWISIELDLALPDIETGDLVDGTIGELSVFHSTFGIYGHGLTIHSFIAPPGWEARARRFTDSLSKIEIIAPSVEDLIVSKFARGDDKDLDFAVFCFNCLGVDPDKISEYAAISSQSNPKYRDAIEASLAAFIGRIRGSDSSPPVLPK